MPHPVSLGLPVHVERWLRDDDRWAPTENKDIGARMQGAAATNERRRTDLGDWNVPPVTTIWFLMRGL